MPPIPPEAWTSLGYILGGLVLVLIMRRGDVEKVTDKKIDRVMSGSGASARSSILTPQAAGIPADDTNPRLVMAFLERLSRDFDDHREQNREQFARLWDEIGELKNGDRK